MRTASMRMHQLALAGLVLLEASGLPRPALFGREDIQQCIQHVVLFSFKDTTPDDSLQTILEEFEKLPEKIPGIVGFQWGTNNSPENLNDGFTHGFVVTFESVEARDAYLPHEAHQSFVQLLDPNLQDVFAFDLPIPAPAPAAAEPGRVHHLVFFKFRDAAAKEEIAKVDAAFAGLERQVAGLLRYQAGTNNFPEPELSRGFTHGYLLTFINERARDDYLPHPAHREFGKLVGPVLDEVLVLDFTVAPSARSLFVTDGLEPYRVYQREEGDKARIRFRGVSRHDGAIEVRLRAGRRTVPGWDWQQVGDARGGSFQAELEAPVGGEYTVEVRRRDLVGNIAEHTEVANILVGDIWILAGQSNMEGVGDLDGVEEPHPLVHCFTMAHRWEIAKEPLHWLIDSPDPVHSGRMLQDLDEEGRRRARATQRKTRAKGAGLGLPFAKEMVQATGVPIGLIASAHGGTSMEQWSPDGRDKGATALYGSMLKQVRNAGGKVKGVLWYQGESDANPQAAPLYAERLRALVSAIRTDLNSPELPFYYVQIGRFVRGASAASWDRIQELQRLAEADIPNTGMASVIDLPLDDLIHVSTSGLKRAGRRLALLALRDLFGADGIERGPRLGTIESSDGGRTLRVRFEEVNGQLLPQERVAGFGIHKDDGSAVPLIYKAIVDPDAPDTVVLRLQQPAPEDAFLTYGAGLDPFANLVDEEDMAAPAFGPQEIPR